MTSLSKLTVRVVTPARAPGRTKMDEMRLTPSLVVTAGEVGQTFPLPSAMRTVRAAEKVYEMPRTRQLPATTGFGRVKRKSFPTRVSSGGFEVDDRCCTRAGTGGPAPPVMAMVVLRESRSPRAIAATLTRQLPAAAAVKVVDADAGVEKEPHPVGAAVQENEIGSPSASLATAESES